MMAGSVLTVLPVLVLFLSLQRYYIRAFWLGVSKGETRAVPGGARPARWASIRPATGAPRRLESMMSPRGRRDPRRASKLP